MIENSILNSHTRIFWRSRRLNPHSHRRVRLFGEEDYHWTNVQVFTHINSMWLYMCVFQYVFGRLTLYLKIVKNIYYSMVVPLEYLVLTSLVKIYIYIYILLTKIYNKTWKVRWFVLFCFLYPKKKSFLYIKLFCFRVKLVYKSHIIYYFL